MKPMETLSNPVKSVVAFYDAHRQAEDAIIKLEEHGFDLKQFSIVAIDLYTSEKVLGFYNASDRMKKWALSGGFWAGFWGLLFGFSTYTIPFIGPALIQGWLGALTAGLVLALMGAIVGAVAGSLYTLLFPAPKKVKYQTAVKAGKYMLLAQADDLQMEQVWEILELHAPKKKHNPKDWRKTEINQLQIK